MVKIEAIKSSSPSHYGSTATPIPERLAALFARLGLHPTMVRLQPFPPIEESADWRSLHPTMVRLQRVQRCRLHPGVSVSIPLWFDCNRGEESGSATGQNRLHPTMVRLQRSGITPGDIRAISRLHPTMVRLQLGAGGVGERRYRSSPSHYGSTATLYKAISATSHTSVSIPLWFDCNNSPEALPSPSHCLHPTMVRLQRGRMGRDAP